MEKELGQAFELLNHQELRQTFKEEPSAQNTYRI